MITSTANCKQTVFNNQSLPDLLREIADWLEGKSVWDILIESQMDENGEYYARIIEYDAER